MLYVGLFSSDFELDEFEADIDALLEGERDLWLRRVLTQPFLDAVRVAFGPNGFRRK